MELQKESVSTWRMEAVLHYSYLLIANRTRKLLLLTIRWTIKRVEGFKKKI